MNVNKDNIVEIKGLKYVLKKVTQLEKDGGEALGKVPVRYFPDDELDLYLEWINNMGAYELKQHRDAWFYGEGVALQRKARNAAKGEGFTEDDYDRLFDSLDGDTLVSFKGNRSGLTEHIHKLWENEQAENPTSYNKNYVWESMCK